NAVKFPNKIYLYYKDETYTFSEMDGLVNKVSRALLDIGVRQGDQIALFMLSEPLYLATVLASIRIGSEIALINSNLKKSPLIHTLKLVDAKYLLVGCDDNLEKVTFYKSDETSFNLKIGKLYKIQFYCFLKKSSTLQLKQEELSKNISMSNTACYIFTSGTTGLPKAVIISHEKCLGMVAIHHFVDMRQDDVVYTALPLYHTAALLVACMTSLNLGCSVVLRRKFSASNLLSDCRKYKVTVLQYIGEVLRYLCNQSPTADDKNHQIRIALGNGMRPDVWTKFLDRFGHSIQIFEFYASTEGNAGFVNMFNKFGCVGTCSPIMKKIGGYAFVQYDRDTGNPIRNEKGRCIEVGLNEPGVLIAKVTKSAKYQPYKGDLKMTQRKLLHNVFKEGDEYYNSGDVLVIDGEYKLTFYDRVGDTFRWKGENVSTNEVSDTIADAGGIKECNVYGVKVPGCDGRAGMAAIVIGENNDFSLTNLYRFLINVLPKYAVPIFIRVSPELEITSTLKMRKTTLQTEGFDISRVNDPIYVLDPDSQTYAPLTPEIFQKIENCSLRF
uniref:long-chain-fatty-acid--CoA ligase n=1 Tax=Ciona savignyi TaxID=51511 RepID=H2Z7Y2_CIOSA